MKSRSSKLIVICIAIIIILGIVVVKINTNHTNNVSQNIYKKGNIYDRNSHLLATTKNNKRYYPEGALASQVIGVTNEDTKNIFGIECNYGKDLDNHCDVYLTIDANIQRIVEKSLNDMASKYKQEKAMCIVMDPNTSEILACANYPSFDPNNLSKNKKGLEKNLALENIYEPGAIIIPVTVAMALDKGYKINHSFGTCSSVRIFSKDSFIKCDNGPHGDCTCKNIVAKSCNIGATLIADKIGKNKYNDYLEKFGITENHAEDFGCLLCDIILEDMGEFLPFDFLKLSFGKGMQTSCLTMCNAYCAIANEGVYHTPKIIKEIKDSDGKKKRGLAEDKDKRVISKKAANEMTECLIACVDEGTGKDAKIKGIETAGKTGIAKKLKKESKDPDNYVVSFAGFAPANDPKLVIALIVEEPKDFTYDSTIGPVWKKIMENSLKYIK